MDAPFTDVSPEMGERILAHMKLRHARRPKNADSTYDFVGQILVSALAEARTDATAENLFRLLHDHEDKGIERGAFGRMIGGEFDFVAMVAEYDRTQEGK